MTDETKEIIPSEVNPLDVILPETSEKPTELVKTFLDLKVVHLSVGDHKDGTTSQVVNVIYGTGAAPTASKYSEGTIYFTYTP
jgi:hypothetical protein